MIVDLEKFIERERPFWRELEQRLEAPREDSGGRSNLEDVERFHYLYQRAAGDLAHLDTFASEPETRTYLESLVARAYAEMHETRERRPRSLLRTLGVSFPRAFRRRWRAFALAVAATLVGCLFGGGAVAFDPYAKAYLLPFGHGEMNPSERVAEEEASESDPLAGRRAQFSGYLMTHNVRVSIFTLALGAFWGVGSLIAIFYNGVILGGVATDYVMSGEGVFLAGWLLPHGSVEIPAILIAGQAGFVLGHAVIGRGETAPLAERLRAAGRDLTLLIAGTAALLVWAGVVEAFFSQYHEPVLPYGVKIAFGAVELACLTLFLAMAGRESDEAREEEA